jgi:hypothetical protein
VTAKKQIRKTLLLAILVLLVVATSTFIGTLAKYSTSETASDSAVAAEFGLNIPKSINLFSDSYTNVQADENGKKIIAPGTEGEYAFVVTGTSEVAYKVVADISVVYSDEWNGYEPLMFSINGEDWLSLADFETALSNKLASDIIEPNAIYSSSQTIYWQWPFYTSVEDDLKDTAMGTAATAETAPSVTISIELTAVQVD